MNFKSIYYGVLADHFGGGQCRRESVGGWDASLQTLCLMMAADYLTGIICALIWKKSPKSTDGAFESKASVKGLFRKAGILLAVLIAYQLDTLSGTQFVRMATILFFIVNDGFSILENLGLMGIPIPSAIKNAFELLRDRSEEQR